MGMLSYTPITPGQTIDHTVLNALMESLTVKNGNMLEAMYGAQSVPLTGLKSDVTALFNGFKNKIINGKFDFERRNNLALPNPASGTFCFDRWAFEYDGTVGTVSVAPIATSLVGAPSMQDLAAQVLRINQSVAGAGGTYRRIRQRIEDARTHANKTITLGCWAAIGAPQTFDIQLIRNYGTGGSPSPTETYSFASAISTGGGWGFQNYQLSLPNVQGKSFGTNNDSYLELRFNLPVNVAFDFYLSLVQIEPGAVATDFEQRHPAVERALCDRFYQKSYNQTVMPGTASSGGNVWGAILATTRVAIAGSVAGTLRLGNRFGVRMRTTPSMTLYSENDGASGAVYVNGTANRTGCTAAGISEIGFRQISVSNASAQAIAADDSIGYHYEADAEL